MSKLCKAFPRLCTVCITVNGKTGDTYVYAFVCCSVQARSCELFQFHISPEIRDIFCKRRAQHAVAEYLLGAAGCDPGSSAGPDAPEQKPADSRDLGSVYRGFPLHADAGAAVDHLFRPVQRDQDPQYRDLRVPATEPVYPLCRGPVPEQLGLCRRDLPRGHPRGGFRADGSRPLFGAEPVAGDAADRAASGDQEHPARSGQ